MKKVAMSFASSKIREIVNLNLSGVKVVWLPDLDEVSRIKAISDSDLVLAKFLVPGEFKESEWKALQMVPSIQIISAGADQVPLEKIGKKTSVYSNVGGWAVPIAEHVLAMALCCSRKLVYQTKDLASGKFGFMSYNLRTLRNKIALIVGYGGIGRESARLLKAIGMNIHVASRNISEEPGVDRVWSVAELPEALEEADLILVSLPLTAQTKGLFNAKMMNAMKEDAIFINVARADIVDQGDLYSHLKDHPDFYAALDVWWNEPRGGGAFSTDYPFFDLPNIVGSCHNSNQIETAFEDALVYALENCRDLLSGGAGRGLMKRSEY